MNPREEIMKNPESLAILKDALEKGVVIDGFTLVDDNIILVDDEDVKVFDDPIRRRSSSVGLGLATAMVQMTYIPHIDNIVLSNGKHTKKIDIYRRYEPNPDAQHRNERCKCGSGKKYKHCCIKK